MRSSFIVSVGVTGAGSGGGGGKHIWNWSGKEEWRENVFELAIAVENLQGFRVRVVLKEYSEVEEPLNVP
jgi:hypothetical protein